MIRAAVTDPAEIEDQQHTPGLAGEPISKLRGAETQVDVRRAGQVGLGLVFATLAVLVVVFVVVGIDKNRQIDELRGRGVPVGFTVTHCQGLLGGSGSNGAGYACSGTYRLEGHTYRESLPGTTALFSPGAMVPAVAVPGDPPLVSPVAAVASEHASWRVFILPAVLFATLVLLAAAVLVRWRRRSSRGGAQVGGV